MTEVAAAHWLATFRAGAFVAMTQRDVVTVVGPDAVSFLQSMVSQDLDGVTAGMGAHALLLQPQGKLVADLRLLMIDEQSVWCHTDAGVGEAFAAALNRFKIRVKADVVADAALAVAMVRGANSGRTLATAGAPTPPDAPLAHVRWDELGGVRVSRCDWPDVEGVDLVGRHHDVVAALELLIASGAERASDDEIETLRIACGQVRQGIDISDTTIAQEAGLSASVG